MLNLSILIITATLGSSLQDTPSCIPGALRDKLHQIEEKFGDVRITSSFRPGARVSGSGRRSLHASCRAVDFNVPKDKYWQVVRWLRGNYDGGVGSYSCGKHHIHIDDGPRRHWHTCHSSGHTKTLLASKKRDENGAILTEHNKLNKYRAKQFNAISAYRARHKKLADKKPKKPLTTGSISPFVN